MRRAATCSTEPWRGSPVEPPGQRLVARCTLGDRQLGRCTLGSRTSTGALAPRPQVKQTSRCEAQVQYCSGKSVKARFMQQRIFNVQQCSHVRAPAHPQGAFLQTTQMSPAPCVTMALKTWDKPIELVVYEAASCWREWLVWCGSEHSTDTCPVCL